MRFHTTSRCGLAVVAAGRAWSQALDKVPSPGEMRGPHPGQAGAQSACVCHASLWGHLTSSVDGRLGSLPLPSSCFRPRPLTLTIPRPPILLPLHRRQVPLLKLSLLSLARANISSRLCSSAVLCRLLVICSRQYQPRSHGSRPGTAQVACSCPRRLGLQRRSMALLPRPRLPAPEARRGKFHPARCDWGRQRPQLRGPARRRRRRPRLRGPRAAPSSPTREGTPATQR
jgi:hypothetical protein